MRPGTVALVGAGPGDPGLITAKGLARLKRAEVVVYDRLVAPELVAQAPRRAKRIYVGKEPGRPLQQERINALLIREARRGQRVVRLKGGDPFVFGRGGEEALALGQAGVPFEVVPGVTSAFAVPSAAGIPVTHRGLAASVSIFTGHEDPHKRTPSCDWRPAARGRGTLVFLMGVEELPRLVRDLVRAGRASSTPCAVIEWGTTPRQRTMTGTLATIVAVVREARLGPPAVVVVGEVVSLQRQMERARRPLAGQHILVTRPAHRAAELAQRLRASGADVACLPAIELSPLRDTRRMRRTLQRLRTYDWVLFTSPEGVAQWMAHCASANGAGRAMSDLKIGAIGPTTAASVAQQGWRVACLPRAFHQEGFLQALRRFPWRGKRVLIPRALQAREKLPETLRRWGATVDVLPLYAARPARGVQRGITRLLRHGRIDLVTFTSSQCVEQFLDALAPTDKRRLFEQAAVASIGPITSASVRRFKLRVAVEAKQATIPAFVDAIIQHLA